MKKAVLIEGAILIALSLWAMTEGFRLVVDKDPNALYDVLGPGYYIFVLSVVLLTTGIAHLVVAREKVAAPPAPVTREMRVRLFGAIGAIVVYLLLISIIGYPLATVVFFLIQFRIVGITSWKLNLALTLAISTCYYFVFQEYCGMVFPRGIFQI
jgi:hypothetical protein